MKLWLIINKLKHKLSKKSWINKIIVKNNRKKKIYWLLQLEGDDYMLPLSQANHDYVSGILAGKKNVQLV